MPELQQDGLDVSAEEERYLRRVFRRFALPYLALILALVGYAVFAPQFGPPAPDSTAAELEGLVAEAASVREAIAVLRDELREQAGKATTRLNALEGGVAKLSDDVQVAKAPRPSRAPSAELKGRMDEANQRINALERRLADALEGRLPADDPIAKPAPGPAWPPAASAP